MSDGSTEVHYRQCYRITESLEPRHVHVSVSLRDQNDACKRRAATQLLTIVLSTSTQRHLGV